MGSSDAGLETERERDGVGMTYSMNALLVLPRYTPRKPCCKKLRYGFFTDDCGRFICVADIDCMVEGRVEVIVETDGGFFVLGLDEKFLERNKDQNEYEIWGKGFVEKTVGLTGKETV